MSYIPFSNLGDTPFEKLLGYAPEVLKQWAKLEVAFFQSKTFDPDFLEQVRRVLAFDNCCRYCMAKAGPPDENPNEVRLKVALSFANKFAIDHRALGAAEINQLKEYFSLSEISEFISFCSFVSASQRVGAVLGLQAAESYDKNLVSFCK